jgi:excisionase family DNA binding protein
MLRDRNTVRMVAVHWECSVRTVYNRLADGPLLCLRLGGIVRISREQVEAYEAASTSAGPPAVAPDANRRRLERDTYTLGQLNGGRELRRKRGQQD